MDIVIENILKLLKKQNKTQKNLTDYLGITQNAFTDWKSGRIKSYNKHLDKIAGFLNVTVDRLLSDEEIETNKTDDATTEYACNIGFVSTKEEQLVISYRNHPELQHAVDVLLGITEENEATLVRLYTAAHSTDKRPKKIISMTKERWEELQNAPETEDTLL